MKRSVWAFMNQVVHSHLGHVLLAVSWTFILLVFVRRLNQPQLVDCVPTKDEVYSYAIVDKVYPIWTAAIGFAHFPSILLTQIVTKLFQRILSLSCAFTAKLEVPLLFGFSAIQWLFVGYTIESVVRRARSRR